MYPNQAEWDTFYASFKKLSGLDLHKYKANQLQRRVWTMVESKSFKDLPEFTEWLKQAEDNIVWFLDRLAINVSEMFRNPAKWEELRTIVLPHLLKSTSRLKCWSAGCSYGAEAHSLAMLLDQYFPGQHSIVGTDIDVAALDQARRGEFSLADTKNVPRPLLDKYLAKDGETWRAQPSLKRYLSFKKQNILDDPFDKNFDLILCRNVVIYFTDEAKDHLYHKFFNALRPGGILLVGGTERIFSSESIGFESSLPFFYERPDKGEKLWRNAS